MIITFLYTNGCLYAFAIFHFFHFFHNLQQFRKISDKITIDSDIPIGIIFEAYFDECCINRRIIPSNLKTASTANTQHHEMQLLSTQEYSVKSLSYLITDGIPLSMLSNQKYVPFTTYSNTFPKLRKPAHATTKSAH